MSAIMRLTQRAQNIDSLSHNNRLESVIDSKKDISMSKISDNVSDGGGTSGKLYFQENKKGQVEKYKTK